MNQLASLQKGLIFNAPLNEWYPAIDTISNTLGTATATYNVPDRQGGGANRRLEFDGVNDYVTLPTISSASNWTLIVKSKNTNSTTNPLYIHNGSLFYFHMGSGKVNIYNG